MGSLHVITLTLTFTVTLTLTSTVTGGVTLHASASGTRSSFLVLWGRRAYGPALVAAQRVSRSLPSPIRLASTISMRRRGVTNAARCPTRDSRGWRISI
jgi:hypothetical protein